jgi:hypothetical protein
MWGKVIPDDYVVHFSDRGAAEAAGFMQNKKRVCQKLALHKLIQVFHDFHT